MNTFKRYPNDGYPIGPAPQGWEPTSGCSRVYPHNEQALDPECQWQDDEMNSEHYPNLRCVVVGLLDYEGDTVLGVFDNLWDAAEFAKRYEKSNRTTFFGGPAFDGYDIEGWSGSLKVKVPSHWRDA